MRDASEFRRAHGGTTWPVLGKQTGRHWQMQMQGEGKVKKLSDSVLFTSLNRKRGPLAYKLQLQEGEATTDHFSVATSTNQTKKTMTDMKEWSTRCVQLYKIAAARTTVIIFTTSGSTNRIFRFRHSECFFHLTNELRNAITSDGSLSE